MIAARISLMALVVSAALTGCSGEPPKQGPKMTADVKAQQDSAHAEAKKKQAESKAAETPADPAASK